MDYNLTIVRNSLNRFDNNESPYLDLSLSRYNILPLFISGINRKYISVLDIGGGVIFTPYIRVLIKRYPSLC